MLMKNIHIFGIETVNTQNDYDEDYQPIGYRNGFDEGAFIDVSR